MELTLYLENGKTLNVDNANISREDEAFIIFTYFSGLTGKKRRAKFNTQKLWGWVTSVEEVSK